MAFTTVAVVDQASALKRTPLVISLTLFYTSISVLCLVYLIMTLVDSPIGDADVGSASWAGSWSIAAVVDFYVAALCMCGIILMTEGLLSGMIWSILILCLGSPVVCLYMFNVFRWYGGYALVSKCIYQRPSGSSAPNLEGTLGMGYTILGIAIIVRLVWNYLQYPFLPMETESDTWSWEWLLTSIANFYAVALCMCGIIISSQHGFASSVWCLCILIVGAPACCMYMAFRLLKYGTIALACHQTVAKELGEDVPPILRRTSSKAFATSGPSPQMVPPLPDRRSSSKQSITSNDGLIRQPSNVPRQPSNVTRQPSKDSKESQQFGVRTSGGGDVARISSGRQAGTPGAAMEKVPDLPQRSSSKQSSGSNTRVPSKESNQPRASGVSRQNSKEFGQTWSQRRSDGEGRRAPFGQTWSQRGSQTPPPEAWNSRARSSPRVLVHAPAPARTASTDGANESAAPSRAASKEAAQEPAGPARVAQERPVVTSPAYEVETDETTFEERTDAI